MVGNVRFHEMKMIIQIFIVMSVITSMTGCASTKSYLVDRGHDAADILTATAGDGVGARARIGPIHAGLIFVGSEAGLRGGALIHNAGRCNPIDVELIGLGFEAFHPSRMLDSADNTRCDTKSFDAESTVVPFITTKFIGDSPLVHPYWTQCDVQIGLIRSLRIGINPGELLDFILGLTTLDIYGDDLEIRKRTEKSNQSSEATPKSAPQ